MDNGEWKIGIVVAYCLRLKILNSRSNLGITIHPTVVARSLHAVLTKQSRCHYSSYRRCEVTSCCPHEAISVSLFTSHLHL